MEIQKWLDIALDFIINFGPKVLGAIIIWIIGSWVIKKLLKAAGKVMTKGNYDESLQKFLSNLLSWVLKIILIVVVLGTVGVETTSFAAILAAAGLAIGLALQGSLSNFASGILLISSMNPSMLALLWPLSVARTNVVTPRPIFSILSFAW